MFAYGILRQVQMMTPSIANAGLAVGRLVIQRTVTLTSLTLRQGVNSMTTMDIPRIIALIIAVAMVVGVIRAVRG